MGKSDDKIECPEYDVLVEEMETAKARVAEAGKAAVGALFKQFFAENPQVTAVGWKQYTPYFNDGEACEFGLRDCYVTTRTDVDFAGVRYFSGEDDEDGFVDRFDAKDPALKEAIARLERSRSTEIFEAAFGDHALVIATPEGFHVSEYSHD